MRTNSLMEGVWRNSEVMQDTELPVELREVLRAGWLVGPAGSLLLRDLYGSASGAGWSPEVVAQYEYEINDVWVSTAGLPNERSAFLSRAVSRARSFALLAMKGAEGLDSSDRLIAVISLSVDDDYLTHGVTVKLFTRRGDHPQYFDDLERFKLEAIAVIDAVDGLHGDPASSA